MRIARSRLRKFSRCAPAMSLLVEERTRLGDHEPIFVNTFFIPRRAPAVKPLVIRPVKRRLVPAENRAR